MFEDGLKMKKKDKMIPRKTPRKMKTEKASIWIVVSIFQSYKKTFLTQINVFQLA
jgi:hypothetical protein